MNHKRNLYVQVRLTQEERKLIDDVAKYMRRSRSDAMRTLALEKAEVLGLIPPTKKIMDHKSVDTRSMR